MGPEAECRKAFARLVRKWISEGKTVSAMESCTGGYLSSLITDNEGASAVFGGAFVTYCNGAKIKSGVSAEIIDKYGVYSTETACAMAKAAQNAFCSDFGIGVTGSLGRPDPDNPDSHVGTVYIAVSGRNDTVTKKLSGIAERNRRLSKAVIAVSVAAMLSEIDN